MVFAIHQRESTIGVHMSPKSWTPLHLPFPLCPSRLSQSICFMHRTCTSHLFYIWSGICFNAILSNHPILSFSHWACTPRKPELKEMRVPQCPLQLYLQSADEWIRKLWYIHTLEYYSAIKRNTFESDLMRWMNLESSIQSEVSQKEKDKYSILMHIYGI